MTGDWARHAYLQLHGPDNVRILDAGFGELAAERGPVKTYMRSTRQGHVRPDRFPDLKALPRPGESERD